MRKSSMIRLAAAVSLVLGGSWVAYTQGRGPAASKLDTVKIKDDLFVIHNEAAPGNVTVLVTNDGLLLVDDKFAVDHAGIMEQIKKISDKPIKYVVNTHHHGDHTGGNAQMLEMSAQIVASQQARENMVDGKMPGLPNMTIERHGQIFLGGKVAEMYYFGRAHTNGDIVILFPAQRALAAGDMFTFGDATPQLIDYSGGGSAKEWAKTLDGALKLDFDTAIPGHGLVTTKAEMAKFRDSTITTRNRIHEMVVAKKTRDEIGKTMQSEFHWGPLQMARSLDGAIAELQ